MNQTERKRREKEEVDKIKIKIKSHIILEPAGRCHRDPVILRPHVPPNRAAVVTHR